MEAEVIRDHMLSVSGSLLTNTYGPSTPIGNRKQPFNDTPDTWRRSVYLMSPRFDLHPVLKIFDPPDNTQSIGLREVSTTPSSTAFMLNAPFCVGASETLCTTGAGQSRRRSRPTDRVGIPNCSFSAADRGRTRDGPVVSRSTARGRVGGRQGAGLLGCSEPIGAILPCRHEPERVHLCAVTQPRKFDRVGPDRCEIHGELGLGRICSSSARRMCGVRTSSTPQGEQQNPSHGK